ncbi:MarR family transcriptional regulator [Ferrovibrio sp.]|uniref:MarR family winged helix-turn-helix transcriptional regulator n=1 Tax=Ferrovibrio sp. TaxID=1917215 RepID=UPI001B50C4DE|nr:MarR family transcriptional regulator [Ferrovibrio sp.]MBP7065281.1 MarR family transcriptional regulator [Ferrovibrio sp.]
MAAGKAEHSASSEIDYGDLPDLIGYVLRRAQLRLYEDFYAALHGTGISPALFSALVLVERNPGLQQGRLGQALGVARSGAMTMVDRLERLGLVQRQPAPHDRRAYGLHLTPKGQKQAASLRARVSEHDQRIGHRMDAAERRKLMELLQRI